MVSMKAASGCGSVPAIASPSACSALASSAGSALERVERLLAQRQRILVEERQCARDAAVGGGSGRPDFRIAAGDSVAAASAAATSARASGRSVTMRQRERNVGGTRQAEWLTSSKSARSRRLFQHLEQRIGAETIELVDRIDDGDPPAPLACGRAEKRHRAADVLDSDLLAQHALVVRRALKNEEIGMRRAAMRRATGCEGSTASDVAGRTSAVVGSGCAKTKRASR